VDLLIPANPTKLSNVDSPEAAQDIPGPSKMKNLAEAQDMDNTSVRIVSISPDEGDDGEEIEGVEIEQQKGKVPLPRDKEDSSKKRKLGSNLPFLRTSISEET
jgi:hypothetical protein